MNMPAIDITLFDALTEAGVKPETARRVEKKVEIAILAGQEAVRAEMHEQLMTKSDGEKLKSFLEARIAESETRLLKANNDNTWKMVAFVVAANGLMLTVFKLLG
jgi:hypothetical protein